MQVLSNLAFEIQKPSRFLATRQLSEAAQNETLFYQGQTKTTFTQEYFTEKTNDLQASKTYKVIRWFRPQLKGIIFQDQPGFPNPKKQKVRLEKCKQ